MLTRGQISGLDTERSEGIGHDTQYSGLAKRDLVGKSDPLGDDEDVREHQNAIGVRFRDIQVHDCEDGGLMGGFRSGVALLLTTHKR